MSRGRDRERDKDYRTQVERPAYDRQALVPDAVTEAEERNRKRGSIPPIDSREDGDRPETETQTEET